MKKVVTMVLALGLLSSMALANVTLTVDAKANALHNSPLNTGIGLNAGDHLVITVDAKDWWSAGDEPRTSNADGLTETNPYYSHPVPYTYGLYAHNGFSFHYGSLVGQIDNGGYFKVGTSYNGYAANGGVLKLMYWDSYFGDNSGDISAELGVNIAVNPAVPAPGALLLGSLGTGLVGWLRRRKA